MHWVQALIASERAISETHSLCPSLVVCPLPQGLALVPMTHEAERALGANKFASLEPSPPLADAIGLGNHRSNEAWA